MSRPAVSATPPSAATDEPRTPMSCPAVSATLPADSSVPFSVVCAVSRTVCVTVVEKVFFFTVVSSKKSCRLSVADSRLRSRPACAVSTPRVSACAPCSVRSCPARRLSPSPAFSPVPCCVTVCCQSRCRLHAFEPNCSSRADSRLRSRPADSASVPAALSCAAVPLRSRPALRLRSPPPATVLRTSP